MKHFVTSAFRMLIFSIFAHALLTLIPSDLYGQKLTYSMTTKTPMLNENKKWFKEARYGLFIHFGMVTELVKHDLQTFVKWCTC